MLPVLIKEFMAICSYLEKKQAIQKRGFLLIPKKELEALLDNNRYETKENKLRSWKELNWIATEQDRMTKRIYVKETGTYIPCICIHLKVYRRMQKLCGKQGDSVSTAGKTGVHI